MTQDQTEDTLLLAYAVRGAKALEEAKRFNGVKPPRPSVPALFGKEEK